MGRLLMYMYTDHVTLFNIGAKDFKCGGKIINMIITKYSRQKWHEISLPAQILGLWVRIQLEAWMSVCVHSLFVLSCVGSGPAMELIPRPVVYHIHNFRINSEWEHP
jgi:hypothetical protein